CLVLLVGVLSVMHLGGIENYIIKRDGQSLHGAIFSAFGLYLNWYEGQTGWLPGSWDVLWSLSIEEVFYLGFPLVCLLTRRARYLVPLLILLALSLPISRAALASNEIWQEKAYLPGMAAIAMGILAALAVEKYRMAPAWIARALCSVGAIGVLAVFFTGREVWRAIGNGGMLLLTFSAACLIIGLHWTAARGASTAVPGTGWLRSFGRLSYEVYLSHMFVVFAVVAAFKASGAGMGNGFIWYLPATVLCWLLGAAIARWFSTPVDRSLRQSLLKPELESLAST
ncbi:MAG: acyltransferase family protein, partial [Dokdonella sp.]